MRFQVPQFIETETKIIGPFTLKQFLFLAAGGVIIFIMQYLFTNPIFAWLIGIPVAGLAMALAFYKVDGVPLPKYLLMALSFLTGTKRYQFRKNDKPQLPE